MGEGQRGQLAAHLPHMAWGVTRTVVDVKTGQRPRHRVPRPMGPLGDTVRCQDLGVVAGQGFWEASEGVVVTALGTSRQTPCTAPPQGNPGSRSHEFCDTE